MSGQSNYSNQLTKKWRAITYDYDILKTFGSESRVYCLTDFQVAWLLSNTDYYGWATRWENQTATVQELADQKSELEYRLMSCINIQPSQIEYIYETTIAEQLAEFNTLYDAGGIAGLNANTPTDDYDGDGSSQRVLALCTACNIYVRTYAQNWIYKAQIVLGIVAIVGVALSLTIVGGLIASTMVAGLTFITSLALGAMQDEDALDSVACCMYDFLVGSATNQDNFEDSLSACGFTGGTNEAIIRDIIASDLDLFDNWLSFLNSLGDSYVLALAGVTQCPCEFTNGYEWDFTTHDGDYVAHASRATWVDGSGWGVGNNDWHIQMSLEDFTSVGIEWMQMTISEAMNSGSGEEFKFRDAAWGDSQNHYDVASSGQLVAQSTTMNVDCTGVAFGVGNVNPTDYDGFITKIVIKLESGQTIPPEWTGGIPVII